MCVVSELIYGYYVEGYATMLTLIFFMYGLMAVKPCFKDTSLLWTVFLVLKERMP